MYHKSLFPDLPKFPESNITHCFVNVATGQRHSFGEFLEHVCDGATALGADMTQGDLGLCPENGELVGILSENCPDYVALLHSLLVITVPFALFSSYSTTYELKHTNSLVQATRIFVSPSLLQLALSSGLPADRIYLLEGESKGHTSYDQLISCARKNGIPPVMISYGNITTTVLSTMPPVWNTPEGLQVTFSVLPLYHTIGLYTTSFLSFFNRSTIVIVPKWDINIFFDSIPKFAPVSQTYQELPKVRPPCVVCKSLVLLLTFAGYGLSEFTMAITMKPIPGMLDGCAKNKPGSAGILVPGVEARIVRPDGSLVGPNEPGELFIRGGCVALGYRGNALATRATFVDGWVRTGDRMRIDEDEVLFFEDRTKTCDTLNISGMQVSPIEIENTILAQPDKLITDVSVAGISGGRMSDERIPCAWIVLSPAGVALGGKEVMARLDAWVQERLSRYKWLRGGIGIVGAIPKSPTGKVLRRVLVEGYEKEVKTNAKL
ncbi:hypothetical protein EDB19DRAFT_1897598 [Suillus lakei]|nr:hypothetical protein EDB19DRAFT_1897598 [Suillus lakei]